MRARSSTSTGNPAHFRPSWTLVCFGQISHEEDRPVTAYGAQRVQLGQRAAIYARVSTADQSCERQIAELTAFAERGGFEVLGIFKETASGTRNNRLVRNHVMELAQARRIDAVLVTELSGGDVRRRTFSIRSTSSPAGRCP